MTELREVLKLLNTVLVGFSASLGPFCDREEPGQEMLISYHHHAMWEGGKVEAPETLSPRIPPCSTFSFLVTH